MKYITLFLSLLLLKTSYAQKGIIYSISDCKQLCLLDTFLTDKKYDSYIKLAYGILDSKSILKGNRIISLGLYDCYAALQQNDSAKKYILKALDQGSICLDNCDDYLHSFPFDSVTNKRIITSFKENSHQPGHGRMLAKELGAMAEADQEARKVHNFHIVDSVNTLRVKQILHTYGWPGYKVLGRKGDKDLWLLVQHADKDVAFQKHALQLLEAELLINNTDKTNYAFLYDRICINEKRPQLFATQFKIEHINGVDTLIPFPLQDTANINIYRGAFGLSKYEDHIKAVSNNYLEK